MKWPVRLYNGVRFGMDRVCTHNTEIIDLGIVPIVNSMMETGIFLDKEYLKEFAVYLKGEEDRITIAVAEMTGYRVNLASDDQVADLIFRRLRTQWRYKPRFQFKLTDSGKREQVSDAVLESIKDVHPVVPLIQEFREYNTLRTSFAETLPDHCDEFGRIHGAIKQTRVITGRLAMTGPNLMGIPTRSDLGKRVKKAFKAPKGRMLGEIDLSQAQMRIAAHVSGCMNMIRVFLSGGDIHSETASQMFDIPVPALDEMLHRYPAKRTGFGILFLIQANGLQDQLSGVSDPRWTPAERQAYVDRWTTDRCGLMITGWRKVNWEIGTWQNEQMVRGRRFSMVWDQGFGRHRLTPGIKSTHKSIRADAERECGNSPIVMYEVGIVKLAMAQIYDTIRDRNWDCQMLLNLHDALLFESDCNMEFYLQEFQKIFANVCPMDIPMKSDYKFGEGSWGDLRKPL